MRPHQSPLDPIYCAFMNSKLSSKHSSDFPTIADFLYLAIRQFSLIVSLSKCHKAISRGVNLVFSRGYIFQICAIWIYLVSVYVVYHFTGRNRSDESLSHKSMHRFCTLPSTYGQYDHQVPLSMEAKLAYFSRRGVPYSSKIGDFVKVEKLFNRKWSPSFHSHDFIMGPAAMHT